MAAAALQNLAIYVVGFSGHSSKSYTGCGKSCLCRQFMYDEYLEEPYSTLLQAEFDGCVINQQHVIYWGQKEVTYTSEKDKDVIITFDVFEHTKLYQDGTGAPYNGEKYEKQIHTPLKAFLNKYSFRSREEILYPEEYSAKKFTCATALQVAYLYVVDVSQSCPVFDEQLSVMHILVNSIKKSRHHCVILASKFDFYCKENYEKLESCASTLKVDVIQSSSKFNTNIDTAFKYLAVKGLQLKKKHVTVNVLKHADYAVKVRRQSTIDAAEQVNIDEIPHISLAKQPQKWPLYLRSGSSEVTATTSNKQQHNNQESTNQVNVDHLPHISMANKKRNSLKVFGGEYVYPPDAVTSGKPYAPSSDSDSDSGGDESNDCKVMDTIYGSNTTSRSFVVKEPLIMKRSNTFDGQDTVLTLKIPPSTQRLPRLPRSAEMLPHSAETSPRLPQKATTFVPEMGRNIYISKPTSTRAGKPLPLLPFESPSTNSNRHLRLINKDKRGSQQNSLPLPPDNKDYVNINWEGSSNINVPDEDSDSSDAYEKIDFGLSDESPPPSPLHSGAESKADVTNEVTQDLPSIISPTTVSTAEQQVSTAPPSNSTAYPEEAKGNKDAERKDMNGGLPLDSTMNECCSSSSDAYVVEKIEEFLLTLPSTSAAPLQSPSIDKNEGHLPEDFQSTECISLPTEVDSMDGSSHKPSSPTLSAAPLLGNCPMVNKSLPVPRQGSGRQSTNYPPEVSVNVNVVNSENYSLLQKVERSTNVGSSFQNGSFSQPKLYANTGIPIYHNVPVKKKPLNSKISSSYVVMYKVTSSVPCGQDQESATESEVYTYDYTYHRNLMLLKSGKDCSGVPPRDIRRSGYTPPSTDHDYVNINKLQNYPVTNAEQRHSSMSYNCPPRTYSNEIRGSPKTGLQPVPMPRANYRPLYPARNQPRPGYFLSAPKAKPSRDLY